MKMATANKQDRDDAAKLFRILDNLGKGYMPESADEIDPDDHETEFFDEDNKEHLRRLYDTLVTIEKRSNLLRVVFGFEVLFNACCDPKDTTLAYKPELAEAIEDRSRINALIASGFAKDRAELDSAIKADQEGKQ